MLVSNSGDDDVKISIDDDPLSDCPVGYEYHERKDDAFYEHIDFMNPNAGSITIEYIMSTGLVRSSPTILALDAILAQLRGDSSEENWDTEKTIGVAQSEVLAANIDRKGYSVQAKSTNTGKIYIGYSNLVTITKWVDELLPGQSVSQDDYRGAIHAILDTAGQLLGWGEW